MSKPVKKKSNTKNDEGVLRKFITYVTGFVLDNLFLNKSFPDIAIY
ncbi:MAG: hypothetical protein ACFFD8_05615 [Candidatus Thorarchaeota archaeon]